MTSITLQTIVAKASDLSNSIIVLSLLAAFKRKQKQNVNAVRKKQKQNVNAVMRKNNVFVKILNVDFARKKSVYIVKNSSAVLVNLKKMKNVLLANMMKLKNMFNVLKTINENVKLRKNASVYSIFIFTKSMLLLKNFNKTTSLELNHTEKSMIIKCKIL